MSDFAFHRKRLVRVHVSHFVDDAEAALSQLPGQLEVVDDLSMCG